MLPQKIGHSSIRRYSNTTPGHKPRRYSNLQIGFKTKDGETYFIPMKIHQSPFCWGLGAGTEEMETLVCDANLSLYIERS